MRQYVEYVWRSLAHKPSCQSATHAILSHAAQKCATSYMDATTVSKSEFFFNIGHLAAGGVYRLRTLETCHALLYLSFLALRDGAIVSASMRRSFHMRSLQRFSASVSRYRPPDTSGHALQAHRLGAASRSPQQAHSWQVVKAFPGVVFQPGHLQGVPSRCAASPHFRTQNGPTVA